MCYAAISDITSAAGKMKKNQTEKVSFMKN